MLERDIGKSLADLDDDLAPEPRHLENVSLIDRRDALLPMPALSNATIAIRSISSRL